METPEAQTIVNAACDDAKRIILDQMIQEEEQRLSQDQDSYQAIRKQWEGERRQFKATQMSKKPKKPTVVQLQQELKDLQSKYTLLCSKLESTK